MSVKVMAIVWDSDLPSTMKFILLAYADHADHNGENIWPAVSLVAEKTGFTARAVQVNTRKLEALGWLVADGKGKRGTNRWKIPLDMGGESGSPLVDGGESHDITGVNPTTQGVNLTTRGGEPRSLEPSLTIKEPSVKPSINGKEKNAIRKLMQEEFEHLTALKPPPRKSAQNELWWTPLREICDLSEWMPNVGNWLMFESVNRLEKQEMTISSPKSIIKTARAIKAERDRGAFKRGDEPKGFAGVRSWLAQGG